MKQLEDHPAAKSIRMMSESEYEALRNDIAEHGLIEPIVLYEGKILDGRNRYKVCIELDIEPHFVDYKDGKPLQYVRSLNVKRRHLSSYELVLEALKDEPKIKAKAKEKEHNRKTTLPKSAKSILPAIDAREELASLAHVSHDTVEKVKFIEKHATPQVKEKLCTGHLSINAAYKPIKKQIERHRRSSELKEALQQGTQPFDDRMTLICSSIEKFEPGRVDVIITDPPYSLSAMDLYSQLSHFAQRTLQPGGSLLVMCGQSYLPDVLVRLTEEMKYQWMFAYLTPGGQSAQLWNQKVNTFWKPIIWLTNGEYKGRWHGDVFSSDPNDNEKEFHHFGQSESGFAKLVNEFSKPGEIICDPFLGGGTTAVVALKLGRKFVGCDIEQGCLDTTLARVRKTYPCKQ